MVTATFAIVDTTAPVFVGQLPSDEYLCDQPTPPAILIASDACGSANVTFSEVTDTLNDKIVYTRTWTATDECGNTAIHTQKVTVSDIIRVEVSNTICEGETVNLGDNSYGLTGTYTAVFTSASGCDSIVTLHLTVNPTKHTKIDAVLCAGEQVVVGNKVYTESVTNEVIHLQTSTGCDSIVTLNLIVLNQDTVVTNRTICAGESVTIGGQSFSSAGTYYIPFQNGQCMGIAELNLEVLMPSQSSVSRTICSGESTTVGGQVFNTSGVYTVVIPNAAGCDSTISLDLTVLPSIATTIDKTICIGEHVTVGNNTYYATGHYEVSLTSANGCDSTVSLNLVVLGSGDTTRMEQSICSGETLNIGGQSFSQAGTYY
ncbi:MAG: hypothetical protein R2739_05265, partial [Chitinophagales bacterium]